MMHGCSIPNYALTPTYEVNKCHLITKCHFCKTAHNWNPVPPLDSLGSSTPNSYITLLYMHAENTRNSKGKTTQDQTTLITRTGVVLDIPNLAYSSYGIFQIWKYITKQSNNKKNI